MAQLYDIETGQQSAASIEADQALQLSEAEQEASDIAAMAATPGWRLFESWLVKQIDGVKENLIDEEDPKKIVQLQQQARACSNIVGQVRHYVELVKELRAQREAERAS